MEDNLHRLDNDVSELAHTIKDLSDKSIAFETRFSNGREVMAEMKKDIAALKPKAPDWLKLLGVGVMILSAQYWLVTQLFDRPTITQVEKTMVDHTAGGHEETDREINRLSLEQVKQSMIVNALDTKLNTILERLPAARPVKRTPVKKAEGN